MKKALPWIAVLLVLAIVVFWGVGRYNGMVGAEESVETAWSQDGNGVRERCGVRAFLRVPRNRRRRILRLRRNHRSRRRCRAGQTFSRYPKDSFLYFLLYIYIY